MTMNITIYHNPRCSKSRKTLDLLKENGISPTIVQYLENAPAPSTTLRLASLMGIDVSDLLRTSETEYLEADDLPEEGDNDAWASWLFEHPRVLQRPIVVDEDSDRAVIGRPPENVLELIGR